MANDDTFNLQEFLPYLLNQAAETSSLEFQRVYKDRYGMLRTEWRVLFHLGLYGSMTAVDIVNAAQMHKTKISRAVHRLVERRFVRRTRDSADRRVEHLDLTARGRAAYEDLRNVARHYNTSLSAQFDPSDLDVLQKALRLLAQLPGDPSMKGP